MLFLAVSYIKSGSLEAPFSKKSLRPDSGIRDVDKRSGVPALFFGFGRLEVSKI